MDAPMARSSSHHRDESADLRSSPIVIVTRLLAEIADDSLIAIETHSDRREALQGIDIVTISLRLRICCQPCEKSQLARISGLSRCVVHGRVSVSGRAVSLKRSRVLKRYGRRRRTVRRAASDSVTRIHRATGPAPPKTFRLRVDLDAIRHGSPELARVLSFCCWRLNQPANLQRALALGSDSVLVESGDLGKIPNTRPAALAVVVHPAHVAVEHQSHDGLRTRRTEVRAPPRPHVGNALRHRRCR